MGNTELIVPIGEWMSDEIIPDHHNILQFLLLRTTDSPVKILGIILRKVSKWCAGHRNQLETILDLMWSPLNLDDHGRVCFADDPNLRPEFRTTFTSVNLWDYIYAFIHASHFSDDQNVTVNISSYSKDLFWSLTTLGEDLRRHESIRKSSPHSISVNISGTGPNHIEPMENRFTLTSPESRTGNLFLNPQQSINNFPEDLWEFSRSGFYPLAEWIEGNLNQPFSLVNFAQFQQMAHTLHRNQGIYKAIDNFTHHVGSKK